VALPKVEGLVDEVFADIIKNGVTAEEVERAKKSYMADFIYDSDNQATLARRYGWALAVGRTVADVESWPDRVNKVTREDVQRVASQYLVMPGSVTGYLVPDESEVAASSGGAAPSAPANAAVR
jgi:zinc protease